MPLKGVLDLIGEELKRVEKSIKENFHSEVALIPIIGNYLSDNGGKRIRPMLVLLSSKLSGYRGDAHIIHSCVVEFIHSATLLHDDVVDEAKMRRGSPSANSKWGNKASVLVGDFLFAKSFDLLSNHSNIEIMRGISLACTCMAEGEVLQLINKNNIMMKKEEYLKIIQLKTATLMACCCQIGAILGGALPKEELALRNFGHNLGMAFQLVDDALDYVAKEERLGKTIGKDLKEGNVTLPLICLYRRASAEEKAIIKEIVESSSVEIRNLLCVIDLMRKYKAIEDTLEKAHSFMVQAESELKSLGQSKYKEALIALANYILDREK